MCEITAFPTLRNTVAKVRQLNSDFKRQEGLWGVSLAEDYALKLGLSAPT